MALDAQKALQLSALLAMTAQQFSVNNPGQQQLAQGLLGSAQAGIQAEALKKAKKEQEKKGKGALGGSLGGILGTAAGIALAPLTGGASLPMLALGGGLGGAVGSTLGTAIAGGNPTGADAAIAGTQGAVQGYQYGKASEFAQPDNAAAERPMAETLAKPTIPPVTTLGPNPVGMYPTSPKNAFVARQEMPMLPNGARAIPVTSGVHPSTNAAMNTAQKPVGFGQRLMGGIAQGLGIEQPRKLVRNPDGTVDLY